MMRLRLAPMALCVLLCACGAAETTDPTGLSPGEAQALNEAAAMLDANAIELDTIGNTTNEAAPR